MLGLSEKAATIELFLHRFNQIPGHFDKEPFFRRTPFMTKTLNCLPYRNRKPTVVLGKINGHDVLCLEQCLYWAYLHLVRNINYHIWHDCLDHSRRFTMNGI